MSCCKDHNKWRKGILAELGEDKYSNGNCKSLCKSIRRKMGGCTTENLLISSPAAPTSSLKYVLRAGVEMDIVLGRPWSALFLRLMWSWAVKFRWVNCNVILEDLDVTNITETWLGNKTTANPTKNINLKHYLNHVIELLSSCMYTNRLNFFLCVP